MIKYENKKIYMSLLTIIHLCIFLVFHIIIVIPIVEKILYFFVSWLFASFRLLFIIFLHFTYMFWIYFMYQI